MNTHSEPWYVYPQPDRTGDGEQPFTLPSPPPWRDFTDKERLHKRGRTFQPRPADIRMINAAFMLRRPLLVTGRPGTGKSSLAYAVAQNLGFGEVLEWSITSRSQLKDGLYAYDAIGRLQDSNLTDQEKQAAPIENYIRLGPLGSALADSQPNRPRVLLIDEIDKSDIDLPNDLLNIFEEGRFRIPELRRLANAEDAAQRQTTLQIELDTPRSSTARAKVDVVEGMVDCDEFPFVVLTSNGERDLPPAFLRRCLRLDIRPPQGKHLRDIVHAHFAKLPHSERPLREDVERYVKRVEAMWSKRQEYVPTDQLLNAIHMVLNGVNLESKIDADGQPTHLSDEERTLAAQILRAIR